ncbi:ABC transporter permease [Actinomadura graeca]|uniref:ABC transporter permease n=1 Tax=Actinomadura graeca TaxID=2750812 RepID=A0ABX8R1J5_9ACTN|nr:ABC transporter permease [Actinomadura graeca]QXJ23842.1 ABC transporter permease [Actinomadura graeca]
MTRTASVVPERVSRPVVRVRPAFTQRRTSKILLPLLAVAVCVAVWWLLTVVTGWSEVLLPSPGDVLSALWTERSLIINNTWSSLGEILAGFALAVAVGFPLGVAIAYSVVVDRMLSPVLFAFNAVPKVAVAPILVVWGGFGPMPKIVMAVLLAFFPIVLSAAAGMKAAPSEYRELLRSLDAGPLQTFLRVRLPASLPHLFVGLKNAITLATIGAVIGEFVGASKGLGYLVVVSGGNADTALGFAAVAVLAVLAVALYYIIVALETWLVPWADQS